jgi:LytS/YehU family sensor histidine kinase
VSARLTSEELCVSVSNSGGWREDDPSPGTGLARLRGRLAALYGDRAILSVIRSQRDEVRVDVLIPQMAGAVA